MQDSLFTVQELAAYLHVAPGTVYNWVCQRRIQYIKMHRLLRFDKRVIDTWLLENSVEEVHFDYR